MEREVFGRNRDPRLSGLTNGHRRVLVNPRGPIPDFISIGAKKIRIYHKDQILKCFLCRKEGHLKAVCPSNEVMINDPREISGTTESDSSESPQISDDKTFDEDEFPPLADLSIAASQANQEKNEERPDQIGQGLENILQHQIRSKRKTPETQTSPVDQENKESKKKGKIAKGQLQMTTRSAKPTSLHDLTKSSDQQHDGTRQS